MSDPTSKDYSKWLSRRKYSNEVTITEDEWLLWWKDTEQWDNHGNFKDSVVMARIDLDGPYSLNNIELLTKQENCARAGRRGKQ